MENDIGLRVAFRLNDSFEGTSCYICIRSFNLGVIATELWSGSELMGYTCPECLLSQDFKWGFLEWAGWLEDKAQKLWYQGIDTVTAATGLTWPDVVTDPHERWVLAQDFKKAAHGLDDKLAANLFEECAGCFAEADKLTAFARHTTWPSDPDVKAIADRIGAGLSWDDPDRRV